jgi:lipid-A-disaccharide synthase
LKVALFAGEASGDILGASLIEELRSRWPDATFFGIAGERMQRAGCRSLYPMERLSVMGLFESFGRYRELIPLREKLAKQFCSDPPDVLIGIDAPDFNLTLERKVRAAGIPTVHFVSPSVWAWRRYRVKKIRRSVDLMLTLFPFEAKFFEDHDIPVQFVGHPLADEIPLEIDKGAARDALAVAGGLALSDEVVALLPGSRTSEVQFLAGPLVRTARWIAQRRPGVRFLVPLVNEVTRAQFQCAVDADGAGVDFVLVDGNSHGVMAAADVLLLASGTATLEGLLLKKPMVIAFRATALTYLIMERWIGSNVRFAGLPNLLADRLVVPELMQTQAEPQWLGPAVLAALRFPEEFAPTRELYEGIHRELQQGAASKAAQAIVSLVEARRPR